jgi:hypothetical protein
LNKQGQTLPPWAQGPFELIRHSNDHFKLDGDIDSDTLTNNGIDFSSLSDAAQYVIFVISQMPQK